jgi:preprotein translocase subunit SecF
MESDVKKNWYDRNYKLLLIPPILLFIVSLIFLVNFYQENNDIFKKDVSLTGGTTITVFDSKANVESIVNQLRGSFPDLSSRVLSDIGTGNQRGFSIETKENVTQIRPALEKILGYTLTNENSSTEFSGSSLSEGFYTQLRNSLIAAFLLMGWVVFAIFGASKRVKGFTLMLSSLGVAILLPAIQIVSLLAIGGILIGLFMTLGKPGRNKQNIWLAIGTFLISLGLFFLYPSFWLIFPIIILTLGLYTYYSVPSIMVILCALADIIITVAIVDYLGMSLSAAGIVAFLMLIGYSVDTDILLTTNVLRKKEGSLNQRIWSSTKTGLTMSLTAISSVVVSLLITRGSSDVLAQIFTILFIGLILDIINTWITNASLIKWYAEVKKL